MPFMYILLCSDKSYYTGSTWDLEKRFWEHEQGLGANYTRKRLPVRLVYCEYYDRVEDAYRREKQVQGWSHRKKEALIEGNKEKLIEYSRNYTQFGNRNPEILAFTDIASTGSANETGLASTSSASEEASEMTLPELVDGSREVEMTSTGSANETGLASTSSANEEANEEASEKTLPEPVEGNGEQRGIN